MRSYSCSFEFVVYRAHVSCFVFFVAYWIGHIFMSICDADEVAGEGDVRWESVLFFLSAHIEQAFCHCKSFLDLRHRISALRASFMMTFHDSNETSQIRRKQ